MYPIVDRMAECQVKKWLANERQVKLDSERRIADRMGPYITVSRETEAGGAAIAKQVAEQLGWHLLDHELLDELSREYGLNTHLLEAVDETNQSWLGELLTEWLVGKEYSQSTCMHRIERHLMLAAHHGSFVVVGRGASFILPRKYGLSVRIVAPLELRIAEAVQHRGINADQAKRLIHDTDRVREQFIQKYFHHKVDDPHAYDLTINLGKVTQANAVRLIVDAAREWIQRNDAPEAA